MQVVIDIEANSLRNPTNIWLIVCKDIDTGEYFVFRNITLDPKELDRWRTYSRRVTTFIGHNLLGYDAPILHSLTDVSISPEASVDTLIISRMADYPRSRHSIESYGEEFGLPKVDFNNFKEYSIELENYCIRDVDICHKVYLKYLKYLKEPKHQSSILMEHKFQLKVNSLEDNGFSFNTSKATKILTEVTEVLQKLDDDILKEFPPNEVLIREFTPKETKFGTISKTSVPRSLHPRIHEYEIGNTYRHTKLVPFNPASHKQVVEVLHQANWSPIEKTQGHIEFERELRRNSDQSEVDTEGTQAYTDWIRLKKYGWKINEANLNTLPKHAPPPARTLAKRILYEARRRTLTEWLGLVDPDTQRIHGSFQGIGAWTHRMSHQRPNTANIPQEFNLDGSPKLLGKEMRQLWRAPRNRLLVGVDAEGIQLRIFAHYIDDPEFTRALVEGKKDDKSDPHSLNQRVLGPVCKTRAAAKRFIYALLLGAGIAKLAQILAVPEDETREALQRLMDRYQGFVTLKESVIPADARRGWFTGLDGRSVKIPGETPGERRHLCMSGYLQNGEAIVMKMAALHWHEQLEKEGLTDWLFVNMVHDEWQTEVKNNMQEAIRIAQIQSDSLRIVGEELNLKCPLAGSYWNEDHKDYTIGINWYQTH